MIPQATTVAYLADVRAVPGQEMVRDTLAAAGVLGQQIVVVEARSDRDFEPAFATFLERRADALVVAASQLSTAIAISWWRWRRATRCRPSTRRASSSWTVG